MSRYRAGVWAEYYAAACLMLKGYRILNMRYKTKVGEIDIVARRGRVIIFVEVKFRESLTQGGEAISAHSQSRIRRAAEFYMMKKYNESNTLDYNLRMDAVIITHKMTIHHIKNAF